MITSFQTNLIERNFALLLLALAEIEQSIEEERKGLVRRGICIDTYQIFKFVDISAKKFLDVTSMSEFLNRYDIVNSVDEVEKLIQFYDSNEDGRLEYAEFLNLILADSDEGKDNIRCSNDKGVNNSGINDKDLVYEITLRIFKKELDLSRRLFSENGMMSFNNYLFSKIDRVNRGYFDNGDLQNFFNYLGISVKNSDTKAMIRRLDLNKDGRVSTREFGLIFEYQNEANIIKNYTSDQSQSYSNYTTLKNNILYSPKRNNNNQNNYVNFSYPSKEELIFLDFLREIIEIETHLENLKCDLSLQSDFNLHSLFSYFETEGKDFLTLSELIKGFNYFNLFPASEETNLIIKRYDFNRHGVLYFEDFCDIFSPLDTFYRDKLVNRLYSKSLSENTGILVKLLLNALFIGEAKIELIRKKLNGIRGVSIEDMFRKIDDEGKKFIIVENVRIKDKIFI